MHDIVVNSEHEVAVKNNIDIGISSVTVYTDRALVTRQDTISLTGNEKELIISNLPVTLLEDSVRVAGQGTSKISILGVKVESVFTPEVPVENIAELDREIQTLQNQKASLKNQVASRQLQLSFIEQLSEKSKTSYAIHLSKQQTNLEQTEALLDFISDKYIDYGERVIELNQQQQELTSQIDALKRKKQRLSVPQNKEYFNLIIFIEASESGELELEVSYLVTEASWQPLYDLRVDTEEKQLNLTYLAEIKQSTGEEWQNVALTLSTAKPGLGTLSPKVKPWYIDTNMPVTQTSLSANRKRRRQTEGVPAAASASMMQEEQTESYREKVEVVAATAAKSGSVVTFEINGGGDIPSDGTPHKVTVFSDRYPVELEYIAIPRLVSFVYLQAVVTNPATGVTLLPGKGNILREQTFVGTTSLENIAPSQEFTLNLGIDESWKIERNLVQRQADKKLIGSSKRVTYAYRLIVNNLQAEESSLKLIEQLPVSRNEQIKVRLIQSEPKIKLGEMGAMEWNVTLAEGDKQEINYQFTLEYPSEVSIYGLNI